MHIRGEVFLRFEMAILVGGRLSRLVGRREVVTVEDVERREGVWGGEEEERE